MPVKTKERDYLFDNYKALLIILVIMGHFIDPCYRNNLFLYSLKYIIYAFHMPAFIFISGYFSKKDASFISSVQKILIPYLCFQTLYYLYYEYILGLDANFIFLVPKFTLWYLITLFAWKVITPYFKKIPHYFLLSVVMGLLFGFLPIEGERLSISRIFVFYPYFLAGTLFNRDKLISLRTKRNQIVAAIGIIIFVVMVVLFTDKIQFKLRYFYGKTNYSNWGLSPQECLITRLFCYIIGFSLTYGIAILMCQRKNFFSSLGSTTRSVYLFHGLFYKFLLNKAGLLHNVNTAVETILLLAFCVALAFIFSLKPFCKFTDFFYNIKLPFFKRNTT